MESEEEELDEAYEQEEYNRKAAEVEEAIDTLERLTCTDDVVDEVQLTPEETSRLLQLVGGFHLLEPLLHLAWKDFLKDIKSGARKRLPFDDAFELFKRELKDALAFVIRDEDGELTELLEPEWRRFVESNPIQLLGWSLSSYIHWSIGSVSAAFVERLLDQVLEAFDVMAEVGDFVGSECIAYPELCPDPKECPHHGEGA